MLFVSSRYAEARTNAAAVNAAILPGGVIRGPSDVWPTQYASSMRHAGRLLPSLGGQIYKLSIDSFLVKMILYASMPEPPGGPDRFRTWDSRFWSELNFRALDDGS